MLAICEGTSTDKGKKMTDHTADKLETTSVEYCHDDVITWKHFPRYWPFVGGINRSPVDPLHKGQWRGALMFSLICAWINGWANNGDAGDLRRDRAHYDVTVTYKVEVIYLVNMRLLERGKHRHKKLSVVTLIVPILTSLEPLHVVVMTTGGAGSDDVNGIMTARGFKYCASALRGCHLVSEQHWNKMSSFWRNFHHWLHWKLSLWQLPVQPMMNISSKWRLFCFSETAKLIQKSEYLW